MKLEELRRVDLKAVDRTTLVQRKDIKIDPNKDKQDRIMDYIRQTKNPYIYADGKYTIKISFSETERTIEECMHSYLSGL